MDERHRQRLVIEDLRPEVDGGRFPIKRVIGEEVAVEADVFIDGHEAISCVVLHCREQDQAWIETPMEPLGNDRWRGVFITAEIGRYRYTVQAWVDRFKSWSRNLAKKVDAGQDVSIELLEGANLLDEVSERASVADAQILQTYASAFRQGLDHDASEVSERALDESLAQLVDKYPDRPSATTYEKELVVVVDDEKARFSTWYEMFPRSCSPEPGRHGTFKDCEDRLPYIAALGFDVVYLPPIHPIGRTHRKGKNNSVIAGPEDPGSPWAIGSAEGGHKAIHPQLGTMQDFRRFMAKAREYGIEVALDMAFQFSPDHPYVKEHPEWFRWRPDGTLQYAENPPKKYEDIYPFNSETEHWQMLWDELKDIIIFWIEQGIRVFRVDNPHTKPFRFWEWLISEVKREHPEAMFLSEAFTRPKVMYHLAKLGFTQSYTYFAWRNTKRELTEYLTELTQTNVREYFHPNLWPNTPDILTEYLQFGGRPAFQARLVLAATLSASYGIYGPAFELMERQPRESGSEEYLDSEKYEVKYWNLKKSDSLKDFIARVNRIRRENPALHSNWSLRFHPVDNDQIICYSKANADRSNIIVVVVALDPHHAQSGIVKLPLHELGLDLHQPYQVHDLLGDARYLWNGPENYVQINPQVVPANIFRVRRRLRTEQQFEYYM